MKKHVIVQRGEKREQCQRMKKGVAVLLEDGDELHIRPTLKLTYCVEEPQKYEIDRFSELQLAEQKVRRPVE